MKSVPSSQTAESHASQRTIQILFVVLWAANVLFHLPSFLRDEFVGDEHVNLALAFEMGWDTSHLTTMDLPAFRSWPSDIYQKPLYLHGPLFPYVLKIGMAFEAPGTAGFLFANLCMALYFFHLWQLVKVFDIDGWPALYGAACAAFAALLMFSTTRLHHDALVGLFCFCSAAAFAAACQRSSVWLAIWAGVMASCALNVRFNGLLILPLLVGFQLYHMLVFRTEGEGGSGLFRDDWKRRLVTFANWKVFLIVAAIVGTVGMQHAYRLLLEYGTLVPSQLNVANFDDPWYRTLANRTRAQMTLCVFVLIPVLFIFLTPLPYRRILEGMRKGSWGPCFVLAFLFLFVVIDFRAYEELRRFSSATPFLYGCLPFLFASLNGRARVLAQCLVAATILSGITTSYIYVFNKPNQVIWIVPSLYEAFPPLMKLYGPTGTS